MPKPTSGATNITLNISQSSVANLNLGAQIGHIQSAVGGLHEKGLRQVADAIQALTEALVNAPELSRDAKQEAVESVSVITEEVAKSDADRRPSVIRLIGAGLWELVKNVDNLAR